MRRFARSLLWIVGLLSIRPDLCADDRATLAGESLSAAVSEAQQAVQAWDFAAMTNGAARLAAAAAGGAEAEYQRVYWRAVVLLHAVFYARGSAESPDIRAQEASLRRKAVAAFERAVALRDSAADAHAAIAVLLGMAIRDGNWLTALRLAPRLMHHRKAAEQFGSNARALYLDGVGRLRTAKDRRQLESARETLLGAVRLFESERSIPAVNEYEPRWGYDHALMFLAQTCAQLGRSAEAANWSAKARQVNPYLARSTEQRK